jgi:MoaA/NifB/PqqE/SkfB family radical SAM enzyme
MRDAGQNITFIQITTACNAKCFMCNYWKQSYSYMPLKTVIELLDTISEEKPKSEVRLTGGEPCLHPYFNNIIKEATKRELVVSLITNGSFLSEDVYSEEEVAHIFLSVDSPYAKEQKKIRGIELESIPDLYKGRIVANVIVSALNSNSLLDIPKWLSNNNLCVINLIPMKTPCYMLPNDILIDFVYRMLRVCETLSIKHFMEGTFSEGIDSEMAIRALKSDAFERECLVGDIVSFIDINQHQFSCNSVSHRMIYNVNREIKWSYCDECSAYTDGHCDFSNMIYNSLMNKGLCL